MAITIKMVKNINMLVATDVSLFGEANIDVSTLEKLTPMSASWRP